MRRTEVPIRAATGSTSLLAEGRLDASLRWRARPWGHEVTVRACRFCQADLTQSVVDLGMSPLCESLLAADQLNRMEPFYPLHAWVCGRCFLVQVEEYVRSDHIFSEYAYFSSYSDSWLGHACRYVKMIVERLGLGPHSRVVELGSNDGYLLQWFVRKGIRALGIEPA